VKEFQPRSQRQNETEREFGQAEGAPFKKGVYNDITGSSVPKSAVSDSCGYIPFEDRMQTAPGCRKWSDTTLPPLPGRTGYSFSKTGKRITKTLGEDFSESDEGNYIVHDDGKHELIETYVSATQVDVETESAHKASDAGWLRGEINGTNNKPISGKYLLHIDTRLFVFDAAVTAYTRCYCISYRDLLNSFSVIDSEGDNAIIFNAGGIFRIDLSVDAGYLYWKTNSPVPRTLLTSVAKSIANVYGNKYTYGCARLSGDDIARDRTGSAIEHETGTCYPSTTDYKDYAEVWGTRPVGPAITTYDVLAGGVVYDTIAFFSAISNGQWSIPIDGVTTNFAADFTGVVTMADVATRIQNSMRTVNSKITVEFMEDHLVIRNPVEGGTLGYTSAGTAGTDIGSATMGCQSGVAAIAHSTFTVKRIVGTLHCPVDPVEAAIYQSHHTHYPVWRSLDLGQNGIDPLSGEGNNEEQFIWLCDVPIAKAFVAARSGTVVTATAGTFQVMDEGAKLRFQDGTEITLETYVSATEMTTTDAGSISGQAAAIGGDYSLTKSIRVMTAAQTTSTITGLNTVTRSAGTTFSVADVGKTIYWPNGLRSHIIAYVDENSVTVSETQTILSTGACIDPKCRNFTDNIDDDTLRSRIKPEFSLFHRFWEELPDCDTGALMSGWIFAGIRDTKIAYYGQVTQKKEHLIGYYYAGRQYLKYKDKILGFSAFPDSMTVYCANSTIIHPTNTFISFSLNKIQSVCIIAGQTTADEQRGVWDCASFKKMPDGIDIVITSEPRLRYFDGRSFSEDIADKRYTKTIEKLARAVALLYDSTHGLTIYGREA